MPIVIRELKGARAIKGLSQKDVADLIGVHVATYQRFETQMGNLNLDSLERLAAVLGVSTYQILEWRRCARKPQAAHVS